MPQRTFLARSRGILGVLAIGGLFILLVAGSVSAQRAAADKTTQEAQKEKKPIARIFTPKFLEGLDEVKNRAKPPVQFQEAFNKLIQSRRPKSKPKAAPGMPTQGPLASDNQIAAVSAAMDSAGAKLAPFRKQHGAFMKSPVKLPLSQGIMENANNMIFNKPFLTATTDPLQYEQTEGAALIARSAEAYEDSGMMWVTLFMNATVWEGDTAFAEAIVGIEMEAWKDGHITPWVELKGISWNLLRAPECWAGPQQVVNTHITAEIISYVKNRRSGQEVTRNYPLAADPPVVNEWYSNATNAVQVAFGITKDLYPPMEVKKEDRIVILMGIRLSGQVAMGSTVHGNLNALAKEFRVNISD